MSSILNVRFGGGYVSTGTGGRDASDLDQGELQSMSGAYYRKDDPHQAWKMAGRTLFGSTVSGRVNGVVVCQFDEAGSDKLLASVGTKIYGAVPGITGTFSELATGLSSDARTFVGAHQDDRWYLCNGMDENRVLMPDGTVRLMGMRRPSGQPTCVPISTVGATVYRPTVSVPVPDSVTPGLLNPNLSFDGDDSTCASFITPPDSHPSDQVNQGYLLHRWSGFVANSGGGRTLKVKFSGYYGSIIGMETVGGSGQLYRGTVIRFQKSEDGGVTWDNIWERTANPNQSIPEQVVESPVTVDSSLIQFRIYVTAPYADTAINIFDVRIEIGSDAVSTTTVGIYYATTERFDAEDIESPPSEFSGLVELDNQGAVIVTRPPQANPSATHWQVYRVGDGVEKTYGNAGLVGSLIPISQTTWTDPLSPFGINDQAVPVVALMVVDGLETDFRDWAPVPFVSMISWKGSICGISLGSPREWFYSEGGRPESFPKIYTVKSFPLDENDRLVGQMAVGESLVFLCKGACLAIDEVPRLTDGVYNQIDARPLKGHPGCVGIYAYATWSVAGEPRGAWVSPHGVYVTNGTISACISTDLAWTREVNVPFLSTSVLKWDANNLILWFEYDFDGDGNNDREMAFHMAEIHAKDDNKHKLSQPTEKATSCMAFALVEAAYLRYSGHPTNGEVYLEESGTSDAATGDEVEMVVRSNQISNQKVNLGVIKATVAHSDFGAGETGTIVATLYRDSANTENSRSQSVRLDGNRGTTVGIGRAGELVDVEVSYSGPGIGGLGGVQLEIDGQGRSGSAPRVSSSSATQ